MTKISIIGAGSSVFTKNIVTDLLTIDKFKSIEIALMDIDNEQRLNTTYEILNLVAKNFGANPIITLHTNRRGGTSKFRFCSNYYPSWRV